MLKFVLKFALPLLLGLWVTLVDAADLQPAKVAEHQKSTIEPVAGVVPADRKPIAKLRAKVPQVSKDPKAPLPLLDGKNLGLGCAEPS